MPNNSGFIAGSYQKCAATKTNYIQCESKKYPLQFSDIFSQTVGNFLLNFYTPIIRTFLH